MAIAHDLAEERVPLGEHRPDSEELFAALVREAICWDRTVGWLAGAPDVEGVPVQETLLRGQPISGRWLVDLDRERQILRLYHGDLLERLHPVRDDPAGMRAAIEAHADHDYQLQYSLLARVALFGTLTLVRDYLDQLSQLPEDPPPPAEPIDGPPAEGEAVGAEIEAGDAETEAGEP